MSSKTADGLHSIVVPVYNSGMGLDILVREIDQLMKASAIRYELVMVDDGSRDDSYEKIKGLAQKGFPIRGFRLSRNFGHQAALAVGLRQSRGEFVAIIDDDMQDPPSLLPGFFKRLYDGYDVVYGIRRERKEGLLKRMAYALYYRIFNQMAESLIPMDAGDFCCMRRRVVDAMLQLCEARPFWRGIRAWVGFRQTGIEYTRAARAYGSPGYNIFKYIRIAMTGILGFSYVPLRLATFLGLTVGIISFIYAVVIVCWWFIGKERPPGYASLIVFMAILGSTQLLCLGIMGEYISRLCDESRKWPIAFISESTQDAPPE